MAHGELIQGDIETQLAAKIGESCEPFEAIEDARLDAFLDRVGDARVVLLGEATHGTSEFYQMRARITRELVEKKGFDIIAVEADWPDAAQYDSYARDIELEANELPFQRFPRWMWRNQETFDLLNWLRDLNQTISVADDRVGFYGLDVYSLYHSIDAVLRYLDATDIESASVARERYGCFEGFDQDPAAYGRAVVTGTYEACEGAAMETLQDLLRGRLETFERDGHRYLNAAQNARVIASAERYYRVMYYGGSASWNLRDQHMFDTLKLLLEHRGPHSRAVVWEHNSHLGDASATQMGVRGEHNVGMLCRQEFGSSAYLVGFGTDHGTVAAASSWDGPMEIKQVRPAHPESYECLCRTSGVERFMLPLRRRYASELRLGLEPHRLERAIGVIYRPETERASHYFFASLPLQFDEWIWFNESNAVDAAPERPVTGEDIAETYPFGL